MAPFGTGARLADKILQKRTEGTIYEVIREVDGQYQYRFGGIYVSQEVKHTYRNCGFNETSERHDF